MADETKRVDVIMGPYRGNLLTMSAADAETAINEHWARDPFSDVPYGEGHEPLDDEHRAEAMEAAVTWAKAQWAHTTETPPDPPPPEGGEGGVRRKKAMAPAAPAAPAASYVTRAAD